MNRYLIVETAFGYSAVVFSADPFKLVAIKLPTSDLDALCRPFDEAYWRIDNNHPEAMKVGAVLVRYFNGEQIDDPLAGDGSFTFHPLPTGCLPHRGQDPIRGDRILRSGGPACRPAPCRPVRGHHHGQQSLSGFNPLPSSDQKRRVTRAVRRRRTVEGQDAGPGRRPLIVEPGSYAYAPPLVGAKQRCRAPGLASHR